MKAANSNNGDSQKSLFKGDLIFWSCYLPIAALCIGLCYGYMTFRGKILTEANDALTRMDYPEATIFNPSERPLPDDVVAEDGTPLLSWRVLLALERDASLKERISFDLTKPWDDPVNADLLKERLDLYR